MRLAHTLPGMLASLLAASPAGAEQSPLLAPPALAGMTAENQALYARWTGQNLARAIAFGAGGAAGAAWEEETSEAAREKALAACAERAGGTACTLYAVDLAIVSPDHPWAPDAAPPESIGIGGEGWEVVPDARYLWSGPARAAGAVVHAHGGGGRGADFRGEQPPSWVRHFNNAGFDVFRFDRDPATDRLANADAWARQGLAGLRASGYGRIVFSGHSRGAWNALMALATPGLVDAVIAVAPAAQGRGAGLARQLPELRAIAARADSPTARVAFAQFADDPWSADDDGRAALMREEFAGHVAAVLVIDRPQGITGHGGGHDPAFGDRFGSCLLGFVTEEAPRARC